MLVNDPSSSRMERVYEQTAQQNITVQHIYVVLPIPFVNMDPNNLSTMYILILYAAGLCNKCGWSCINITFDHPFYANAREIVLAEGAGSHLSDVVIRLGGFHILFSSMGSTGTIAAENCALEFII